VSFTKKRIKKTNDIKALAQSKHSIPVIVDKIVITKKIGLKSRVKQGKIVRKIIILTKNKIMH
jgi:hypothetical protein